MTARSARPARPARLVDALGSRVRVVVPDDIGAELDRALVDLVPPTAAGPTRDLVLEATASGSYRLVDDGEVVLDAVARDVAVGTVVWRLNAIAATTTDHVVLHAGCVTGPAGAVLLPGSSGAGKSTLTAAAVADGFGYLSDEHAALDLGTGRLTPFPKPLDLGGATLVPASSIGSGGVAASGSPAAVVFPRFAAGASTTCTPLDPADTLLSLCAQAVNLPTVGTDGFALLAGLAESVPAWQVTYGTTAGGLDAVRAAAAGPPRVAARPLGPAPITDPVTPTSTTVVVRDTVVVLDTTTWAVHRFNASAGLVWLCARETHDPTALAALVQAEAPDGAIEPRHVAATIDHLIGIGLLTTTTPA